MDYLSVDTAGRAAALLDKLPIAGVAVLAIAGLVWVFRRWVKDGQEHREEIRLLNDVHAKQLSDLNEKHELALKASTEARFTASAAFEGTIRELVLTAQRKQRERRPTPERKE